MRAASIVVAVILCSFAVIAGEHLINEELAMGLRVVFSEPVTLTGFGDVFTSVTPEGEATEFVFYGGDLGPWLGHWLSWEPSSATLVRSEWLSGTPDALDDDASQRGVKIIGEFLNASYFAHPAHVMQGVSDRRQVFAMPLGGIPELGLYPTRDGASSDAVHWSVAVDAPVMIEAAIEDDVLYIWASTDCRAGVAEVTLTARLSTGEEAYAAIPVTVFRRDKTLTWLSGRKDFFVPWSPQIDISRIRSVREHAEIYGFEDLSRLDTTVRFSRWRPMPRLNDVEESIFWQNELNAHSWTKDAQLRLTTIFLEELATLGVRTVRLTTPLYINGGSGSEIFPIYDHRGIVGPSMRPDEYAYFINEAHRLGLMVVASTQIWGLPEYEGGPHFEPFQFDLDEPETFWSNYRALQGAEALEQASLGVDLLSIGLDLHFVGCETGEEAATDEQMCQIIADSREVYPGPIVYFGGSLWYRIGSTWNADFKFWEDVDILTTGVVDTMRPLARSEDPTMEELVAGWQWRIDTYFKPFSDRYNKPLIAHENACPSAEGCLRWGWACGYQLGITRESGEPSMMDQTLHYSSFIEAFEDEAWFYGPGFCCIDFTPYISIGGINDAGWTLREKPAQWVIAEYFGAEATEPANSQNGSTEDWPQSALRVDDPTGDTVGLDDIVSFAAYHDTRFVFFAVEYTDTPGGMLFIEFDMTGDGEKEYYLSSYAFGDGFPMRVFLRRPHPKDPTQNTVMGVADCAIVGGTVELRLHKGFLPVDFAGVRASVFDMSSDWSKTEDRISGFHEVPFIPDHGGD